MIHWIKKLFRKKQPEPTIDWDGARRRMDERSEYKQYHGRKKHTFLSKEEKAEIVEYYEVNPTASKKDIASMYDISYSTLCRYLAEK